VLEPAISAYCHAARRFIHLTTWRLCVQAAVDASRILAEDLDAAVSYDDRLLRAANDAGLATVSRQESG
jgi:hypothetical protein